MHPQRGSGLMARVHAARADDGFSLVEVIVALTITVIAFGALAFGLVSGVHTSLLAQQNQQAGDLLSQTVEASRALGYDSLAMRPTDLDAGEVTRSPSISSCACYAPNTDLTSGTGVEALAATDPAGGVYPHVKVVNQNGLNYTVRRYVTAPADAYGATYKRLTVVISWLSLRKSHARTYSTLVTATQRGLPLPDYKFTATGSGLSQCRNPASDVVYSFNLKNNGARDAWNLSWTGDGSWSFYADTDGSGDYSTGDASMNASGTPTTGLLDPTTDINFFAVATLPTAAATPPPYVWNTTFRATSAAQSSYYTELKAVTTVQSTPCGAVASPTPTPTASATPSPTPTPTATAPAQPAASCTSLTGQVNGTGNGSTVVRYYLGNPNYPSNTNASLDMPVTRDSGTPPTGALLYDYSQDLSTAAGRYLRMGTAATADQVATWTYQMPANSSLKGTGSATFWATPASGLSSDAPAFAITFDLLNSDGTVKTANFAPAVTYSSPTTGWGCSGFRPFSVSMGNWNTKTQVKANQKLRISLRVTNTVPVLLAYGTSAYPSEMQLPYAAGIG
ncbi:MAG: type IV pilus modification PilV family protein [Mycobacteriales bacterium]